MKICMSKILTHIRSQQKNKRKKCRPHTHKHPTEVLSLPTFFYTNFSYRFYTLYNHCFYVVFTSLTVKNKLRRFWFSRFFLDFYDRHSSLKKSTYKTQYVCMLPYKLLQVSLKKILINVLMVLNNLYRKEWNDIREPPSL